jgi:hypothetical protein
MKEIYKQQKINGADMVFGTELFCVQQEIKYKMNENLFLIQSFHFIVFNFFFSLQRPFHQLELGRLELARRLFGVFSLIKIPMLSSGASILVKSLSPSNYLYLIKKLNLLTFRINNIIETFSSLILFIIFIYLNQISHIYFLFI